MFRSLTLWVCVLACKPSIDLSRNWALPFEGCGDGQIAAGLTPADEGYEECDDGNFIATDNCTDTCRTAQCGDGLVRLIKDPDTNAAYEECDDGNEDDHDQCLTSCRQARCGDGIIRTDLAPGAPFFEACDDGNDEAGDGCTPTCTSEVCGNAITEAFRGEGCDDGNQDDRDGCRNHCVVAVCGDGVVRTDLPEGERGHEECDDGNEDTTDACTTACRLPRCGDNIRSDGEGCDDGGNDEDPLDGCHNCRTAGCGDGEVGEGEDCDDGNEIDTDGCTSTCVLARCGDGHVQTNVEACDDYNDDDDDACTSDCELAQCGDGILRRDLAPAAQGYEACDDGNNDDGDGCEAACRLPFHRQLLAVGNGFSCALAQRDGRTGVYCWGNPSADPPRLPGAEQLREFVPRINNRPMISNSEQAASVHAGRSFSCFLTETGQVYCWGMNGFGQVGVAGPDHLLDEDMPEAVHVDALESIRVLALGGRHACALNDRGQLFCWGANQRGQTGAADIENPTRPGGSLPLDDRPQKLALGQVHTCALMATGQVHCMGGNELGQIGNGDSNFNDNSSPIANLNGVLGILATGSTSCAWAADNSYCWGHHGHGQILGRMPRQNNDRTPSPESMHEHLQNTAPTEMLGGGKAVCARIRGAFECWGQDQHGQLTKNRAIIAGQERGEVHATPILLAGDEALASQQAVALGESHACAASPGTPIQCWGNPFHGQLGGPEGPANLTLWDPLARPD